MTLEIVEITVVVQQLIASLDADGRDEAVDRASDRDTDFAE